MGSPSGLHAVHGIAAARKGLHVLVEKPIDIRTERADALIAETETAGVKFGVIFQDRMKQGIQRMKELVDGGKLGNPILADAPVNIEAEDTLVELLEFDSGALGVMQAATSIYPGYPRRIELTGSEGTIILEHDRLIEAQFRLGDSASILTESLDENSSASSPVVNDYRAYQAVFEDFIRAIETNSRPACDGHEGRRSLALIKSIYKCSRQKSQECVTLAMMDRFHDREPGPPGSVLDSL